MTTLDFKILTQQSSFSVLRLLSKFRLAIIYSFIRLSTWHSPATFSYLKYNVDGGSCNNRSLAGEIMMRFAQTKGLAGIVVDGCLRDSDGIKKLTMPVYCKGITPQGPYKNGPGEVNAPVACGGQVVFPGDILVGDMDGVVVIRRQDAEEVAEIAHNKHASEDKTFELMGSDIDEYCKKHLSTTEKRKEGKGIITLDNWFSKYGSEA